MEIAAAVFLGFVLDLLLGERLSAICPAVLIGKTIAKLERPLRSAFPKTPGGERAAGVLLVLIVCALVLGVPLLLLWLCGLVHWGLRFSLETFWCYQILATRGLRDASMKVHAALASGDLEGARHAVGLIVGRDTMNLDEAGVTRAAVETVAENTSDGSVAPLFYLVIGGVPLGMLYKAINTMDSMVGYRNDAYRHFGSCAARLDDVANWIPSRLCALLLIVSAAILHTGGAEHMDSAGALRIWKRDRRCSPSPNAAQSESAVAGALGVQLLGDASYQGVVHHKATVGDDTRAIEPDDIVRANHLLFTSATLACVIGCALRIFVILLLVSLLNA